MNWKDIGHMITVGTEVMLAIESLETGSPANLPPISIRGKVYILTITPQTTP